MSQEYANFTLFQALSIAQNTKVDAVRSIASNSIIHLDYCIAKRFSKRRTDISGAETEEDVGPDTGPAGGFVELKITIERLAADQQDTLNTLLQWYASRNTVGTSFRRGFLGLENDDNPSLNLDPTGTLGYKLADFAQVNPVDFKSKQQYIILLQLLGPAKELPALNP